MTSNADQPGAKELLHLSPVKPGERLADKYVIGAELGRGGMGIVVEARDEFLARRVAIKFMAPRLAWSDVSVHRFMQEARAVASLESEHVVDMLEFGRLPSGIPYFVMEYLAGSDLKAQLARHGAMGTAQAIDYLLQALHAVTEGHTKGIVHRDLKPGNLFLTRRADGSSLIKVLDFGIAKTLRDENAEHDTGLTTSGELRLGSPPYMSPEQLQTPRDVDPRSDIWSLGVTLYELLCDRLPFTGANQFELLNNIVASDRAPILAQVAEKGVPSAVVSIVGRCLRAKPAQRYSSSVELAAALTPFGTDEARGSLRRILGLVAPARGVPEVDATGRESLKACTTTLPVPLGGAAVMPSARPSRRKVPMAIGVSVALASGTFLTWLHGESQDSTRAGTSPGTTAPREANTTAVLDPPAISLATPTNDVVTAPAHVAPSARRETSGPAATAAPRAVGSATSFQRSGSRLVSSAPAVASVAAAPSASASAPPATTGYDIEALIRQRR